MKRGNNSCKTKSNTTKVKSDLYQFQEQFIYQISSQYLKGRQGKSRKNESVTDRKADGQKDGKETKSFPSTGLITQNGWYRV